MMDAWVSECLLLSESRDACKLRTSLSLARTSAWGTSPSSLVQNSLTTSSLTLSCHSGCTASRNMAQTRSVAVVSCPAAKKVLHSSITSSVVSVSPPFPCCCGCGVHASSNSPSRSPPPETAPPRPPRLSAPSAASRACMMDMILLLSCLFRRRTCRLRRVGRYLNKRNKKKERLLLHLHRVDRYTARWR
jgi:hypothetical protein